jgi:hypothetical protein
MPANMFSVSLSTSFEVIVNSMGTTAGLKRSRRSPSLTHTDLLL